MYPPTPIAPPVVTTTTVPDVFPMPKPHTVTDMGPPKEPRTRQQRATDSPLLLVSNTTADFAAIAGPYRSSDTGMGNAAQSDVRPQYPHTP
jgi:hypothetical protein